MSSTTTKKRKVHASSQEVPEESSKKAKSSTTQADSEHVNVHEPQIVPDPAPAETKRTVSPQPGTTPDPAPAAQTNEPIAQTFRDLGVIEPLCEACTALGYKTPTPIQQSIPLALQGRDLIGLAETGSGKTAAFALPILQALMAKPQSLFALVMAPTRELAYQISQAFEALGSLISVRVAVLVGGLDMISQAIALGKKPHIVVATPGRLLDHLENTRGFSLRLLKFLVMVCSFRRIHSTVGAIVNE